MFNKGNEVMKVFIWMLLGIMLLAFTSCGSSKSSDEAKALLEHNLKLVGIPQDIVVNICQDTNNNGSCDVGELQAKVSVNRNDTVAQIWEKVKFDEEGRYILENYDPTKNIIMEIEDRENLQYDNGELTLEYKPNTQELSVLQAVVDADFLQEENVTALKALDNREKIDEVLLNTLRHNQNILRDENLSSKNSLSINLEQIAQRLLDVNVTKELPEELNACANNNDCIENIVNNTTEELFITVEEAKELARSKNLADGYIVKLVTPVVAVCENEKEYNSSLKVEKKGKILFEKFPVGTECTLTVSSGAIIDSNNNGKVDKTDKTLGFDMIGSSEDTYITPLTTLLYRKKVNGENVDDFATMIENFNPVVAPNRSLLNTGRQKIEIEKLIILMEVLKTAMKQSVDISLINLSGITNTKSDESIDDLNINKLIAKFPTEVKESITERVGVIQKLINTMKDLDPSKVSLNTFFVSVSDGGKNMEDALNESLLVTLPEGVDLLAFILSPNAKGGLIKINSVPTVEAGEDKEIIVGKTLILNGSKSVDKDGEIVEYEWKEKEKVLGTGVELSIDSLSVGFHEITLLVTDNDGAVDSDIVSIIVKDVPITEKVTLELGSKLLLGSKSVEIAKNRPFNLQLSSNESLSDFYNITLPKAKVDSSLESTKIDFKIKVVNQADNNDYVQLLLNNILISTNDEALLQTKLSRNTSIYIKEQVQGRPTKTYSTQLSSELLTRGLNININSIINMLNKREITDGLNRMEDYLQTSGKKYNISIEFIGVDNSKLEIDFSTILGNISVN